MTNRQAILPSNLHDSFVTGILRIFLLVASPVAFTLVLLPLYLDEPISFTLWLLIASVMLSLILYLCSTHVKTKAASLMALLCIATMLSFALAGLSGVTAVLSIMSIFLCCLLYPYRYSIFLAIILLCSVGLSAYMPYQVPASILKLTILSASFIVTAEAISFSALVLTFMLWLTHLLNLMDSPGKVSKDNTIAASTDENDLASLLALASSPVFAIDSDGFITEWNASLEQLTGLKRNDVLGEKLLKNLISEDSRDAMAAVFLDAMNGKNTESFLFKINLPDKEALEIILNASCRRDDKGKVLGVLGVGQDVTKLRVQERMLTRSQKIESIGLLTGGIAHDFNNLLTIIQGNIELLQKRFQAESGDTIEMLEDAHTAALNGAALTSQLMSFASKRALVEQDIEVNALINKSIRLSSRILGEGVTISSTLASEDINAHLDPNLLESVLLNLFINARDAMDGKGDLFIGSAIETLGIDQATAKQLSPGNYVAIEVRDNGKGIPAHDLEKVIEPFYSTKPLEQGSGLGLSMAYGFIQQSNGALEITSKVGKGTNVKMLFPVLN